MARPVLYVFLISHFCEKARWGLEYCAVNYRLRQIAPGLHRKKAKALGAKSGSLPYLHIGNDVLCDSSAILDWAEANANNDKILTPKPFAKEIREIEARLDKTLGVHIRRYYYSEAMVDAPQTVRPLFLQGLPLIEKLAARMKWDTIRKIMIKAMDLGPEQGKDSRAIVSSEMQWLDDLLSDGREFLVGNQFTRADITAASLLAPIVVPDQHPTYYGLTVPPGIANDCQAWAQRASVRWVKTIYQDYREPVC